MSKNTYSQLKNKSDKVGPLEADQIELEEKFESLVNSSESEVQRRKRENDSELRTQNSELLFVDTNMYVMKVWCEFVFEKCHHWILNQIVERRYDLYLLCNVDLPWVKDELREYPDLKTRDQLYHIYKDIMINQSTPWVDISGNHDERLQKAIKAVNQLMAG